MKKLFIEKEIKYTGAELSAHWIYKNFNICGSAVVAFVGPVEVRLTEMVDIEDVIKNEPISSDKMLNFIIEDFDASLSHMVSNQRLFICIIKEALEEKGLKVERRGDDIFYNGKKLSVSIATKSLTSSLVHTALNVVSEGAPIEVSSLNEAGIFDIKEFANRVLDKFVAEIDDMNFAKSKVRGV
ncbi:MAG: DUF366 family protein [Candidatus Gastranaerophilales bacterium]|nr:DUF366 family protein [Candidatus Gastranaerophilales bacterium]